MTSIRDFLDKFEGVKQVGTCQWLAKCPCHDDKKQSLAISVGRDGKILLYDHAGCNKRDILNAVGLSFTDITPKEEYHPGNKIVAVYEYPDCEKIRFENKSFAWRRKLADGSYVYNRNGCRHSLYIRGNASDEIFLVEGEKDVDNTSKKLGLYSACSEHGASKDINGNKWFTEYNDTFIGKTVFIIPDNDDIGKAFAEAEANAIKSVAEKVYILNLRDAWSEIRLKADISDMIAEFGAEETLKRVNTLKVKAISGELS